MTENVEPNYYQLLGVERDATAQQIRAAFRKEAAKYHSDRTGDDPEAREMSVLIGKAAGVLMKEDSRSAYDRELREQEEAAYAADDSFDATAPEDTTTGGYANYPPSTTRDPWTAPPEPTRRAPRQDRAQTQPQNTYDPAEVDPFSLVDTSRLSWKDTKFDGIKERVVTTHPHKSKAWLFTLGFWVALLVALVVHFVGSPADFFLNILPVLPMVALGWFGHQYITTRAGKVESFVAFVGVIAAYVMSVFVFASGNHPGMEWWRALLVTGILGGGVYAMTKAGYWSAIAGYIKEQRGGKLLAKKDILQYQVWGKAGQVGDTDAFSDHNKRMGVLGEQNTAQLMAYLLEIPGTRVFHCLRFPESDVADVDHAVVNGNKVALIDSKMWQGANYSWADADHINTGFAKRTFTNETHFPKAVRELRVNRFMEADVRGWMTIYSNDGAKVKVDNGKSGLVRLVTPQRMIEEIGAWFTEDTENLGVIDKGLLNAAAAQLKM